MMHLGRVQASAHQHGRAIVQFEALVASFPANEEAQRELMTLYALNGRRSDAVRQFRRCQDAVRAELDTEPEEATLQLYRRIVSREVRAMPRAEAAPPSRDSAETIAVLPFENDTDDSEIDYLSPGIADSVIKNLSQVPGLRVLAFSTVSRYERRRVDPRQLGRELEVFAVVTGHIRRLGETLVVATELVDTADGSLLWGEESRLPQTDVLAVQERISREISGKLRARLAVAQRRLVVKRFTADPEAYRLYLKGRFHWNKRTADGLTRGIDYFEKSIERDPSYALAYSGLADCYNLLSLYSVLPPRDTMPKAKAAAHTSLEIDPSLAEAHTSLAYTYLYYDWDWTAAEREFQHALSINPNYATAHHWYHECLTAMGRFDEQMAEIIAEIAGERRSQGQARHETPALASSAPAPLRSSPLCDLCVDPSLRSLRPLASRAPFESRRSHRWTALLDRIAEGDLDACGTFYDESSQLAFSLIMQAVGDRDLAEDMLVALYVDIRDRAQRGEHRRRNALTWIIELARNAPMPHPAPRRSAIPIRQVMPFEIAWLVGGLGGDVKSFESFSRACHVPSQIRREARSSPRGCCS